MTQDIHNKLTTYFESNEREYFDIESDLDIYDHDLDIDLGELLKDNQDA